MGIYEAINKLVYDVNPNKFITIQELTHKGMSNKLIINPEYLGTLRELSSFRLLARNCANEKGMLDVSLLKGLLEEVWVK